MKQKQEYKWTNREEYPNNNIQELGDKLLHKQPNQGQNIAVINLFDRVLLQSQAAFLQFDDYSKEMQLHVLPSNTSRLVINSDFILAARRFSDIKNYFSYDIHAGHLFGSRGTFLKLMATREGNKFNYGAQWVRSIWERLDSYSSSNRYKVAFFWNFPHTTFLDLLSVKLYRESRENHLDFIDKSKVEQRIFAAAEQEVNTLKHSNLIGLSIDCSKSFAKAALNFGWDYGNRSYFLHWGGSLQGSLQLGSKFQLRLSIDGGQVLGQNVLKNDLLFRNSQTWPGSRSNNFISPRAEFRFKQYPYLGFLNLKPYLYTQGWTVLRRNDAGQLGAKLELQYGLGVATGSSSRLDFSLFRFSGDKSGPMPLGEIKFSF